MGHRNGWFFRSQTLEAISAQFPSEVTEEIVSEALGGAHEDTNPLIEDLPLDGVATVEAWGKYNSE